MVIFISRRKRMSGTCRDKVYAQADAQHREAIALENEQRQILAAAQSEQIIGLIQQNTQLTQLVKDLSQRIETLTVELHTRIMQQQK
jgi:hypothetical protein